MKVSSVTVMLHRQAGGEWRVDILQPTLKSRIKRRLAAVDILAENSGFWDW